MASIGSIGAGLFSDLAIYVPSTNPSAATMATWDTAAEFQALFTNVISSVGGTKATATFVRVENIRELPPIGTPPNIVNVPVYGSRTSQQVQGQSDAPSMEITLNYVPADWAAGTVLGNLVGDGQQYVMRFVLLNAEPPAYDSNATPALGLGGVQNNQYYWIGKVEALQVNPQLTDANQATLTLSVQSDFFGAFTE